MFSNPCKSFELFSFFHSRVVSVIGDLVNTSTKSIVYCNTKQLFNLLNFLCIYLSCFITVERRGIAAVFLSLHFMTDTGPACCAISSHLSLICNPLLLKIHSSCLILDSLHNEPCGTSGIIEIAHPNYMSLMQQGFCQFKHCDSCFIHVTADQRMMKILKLTKEYSSK